MKNNQLIIGPALPAALILGTCGSISTKERPNPAKKITNIQYTCIHPEVISDKPGIFTPEEMKMVEKNVQ